MKGSPFVKPFEKEMNDWEAKLMSMQHITDNWLKVVYHHHHHHHLYYEIRLYYHGQNVIFVGSRRHVHGAYALWKTCYVGFL